MSRIHWPNVLAWLAPVLLFWGSLLALVLGWTSR